MCVDIRPMFVDSGSVGVLLLRPMCEFVRPACVDMTDVCCFLGQHVAIGSVCV